MIWTSSNLKRERIPNNTVLKLKFKFKVEEDVINGKFVGAAPVQ
jgi:hypothetical protein